MESESQTFAETPAESWPNEGRVIFSNVQMRYRDDMEPVLNEIKFDIHPRQKVGIVGRTGAGVLMFDDIFCRKRGIHIVSLWSILCNVGKSSLAAALFRLNELSGGHIYIDGVDIAKISLELLRSKLSTIPQDPVLFAGTMR